MIPLPARTFYLSSCKPSISTRLSHHRIILTSYMIVRHRHDIAYSVRSHTVFALGKNVTKSENINRNSANLPVCPTPSTIAVVLHVSYSWRRVTEFSHCIFLCSPESNTVASGQNFSTVAYRRRRSSYTVSVDRWPDMFRNASRSTTVVSSGAD